MESNIRNKNTPDHIQIFFLDPTKPSDNQDLLPVSCRSSPTFSQPIRTLLPSGPSRLLGWPFTSLFRWMYGAIVSHTRLTINGWFPAMRDCVQSNAICFFNEKCEFLVFFVANINLARQIEMRKMADPDSRLTCGRLNLKTVNLAQLIQIFCVLPSFPSPSFRGGRMPRGTYYIQVERTSN